MHDPMTLRLRLLQRLSPGMNGLDLGAGDGRWTFTYARKRTRITAVDLEPSPGNLPIGTSWIQADIQSGLDAILGDHHTPFNFVFCYNMIQFLDREFTLHQLLPDLGRHVAPGCHLALRTFWAPPTPNIPKPIKSLYQADDLLSALEGWRIDTAQEYEADGPSMDGRTMRTFRLTDILARRT